MDGYGLRLARRHSQAGTSRSVAPYDEDVTDSTGGLGPGQGAVIGAVCLGLLGALVGLVRGLSVYPPTAWFALFEVGVPALIVGALLGAVVGSAARLLGRSGHSGRSRF